MLYFLQTITKLQVPIIFNRILLAGFDSCFFKGLDKPAKWISDLGLNFFKYFSIDGKLVISSLFLFGKMKLYILEKQKI